MDEDNLTLNKDNSYSELSSVKPGKVWFESPTNTTDV